MSFTIPKGWEELTQEELHHIVKLLWLYGENQDWQYKVELAALLYFCRIEVVKRTALGWLCRKEETSDTFILASELLPSMLNHVEWVCRTEEMTVRIEQVGKYKAVDFKLQELMFGDYLNAENYYQAFLSGKDTDSLMGMARILYGVPDGVDVPELCDEYLAGAFLWFSAVKNLLGKWFPHFLKPPSDAGMTISRENLRDNTLAQIRLLTKGDVTKQEYILEKTDTWTALAELDAQACEAEEIKRKYSASRT